MRIAPHAKARSSKAIPGGVGRLKERLEHVSGALEVPFARCCGGGVLAACPNYGLRR
jgi:hypothetical protein